MFTGKITRRDDAPRASPKVQHAMAAMKWWGWGREGVEFTHEDKPDLAPFIERALDIHVGPPDRGARRFEDLHVPEPNCPTSSARRCAQAVGDEFVSVDRLDRVVHARGKSPARPRPPAPRRAPPRPRRRGAARRRGRGHRPSCDAALDADAVLIPFGGGTTSPAASRPPADETRPVISLDLGRLDRVLDDRRARRGWPGCRPAHLGPDIEEQLDAPGWTLGHFPDSFTHSTLGGWIATRSSGMQSDRYGDIADLTARLRVVTPVGLLVTRPVPATSTGPSVREMILGSEGRLGVITEATVEVRRLPPSA